jgi:hypothetical protein
MPAVLLDEPDNATTSVFRWLHCDDLNPDRTNCLKRKWRRAACSTFAEWPRQGFGLGIHPCRSPIARMRQHRPAKMVLTSVGLRIGEDTRAKKCQPERAVLDASTVDRSVQDGKAAARFGKIHPTVAWHLKLCLLP